MQYKKTSAYAATSLISGAIVAVALTAASPSGTLDQVTAAALYARPTTWVHMRSPYNQQDVVMYRHHYVKIEEITGIGGPFPWWSAGERKNQMSLYTTHDKYPTVKLDDRGSLELNLEWILAIERVVGENPGGVVDLEDYLP